MRTTLTIDEDIAVLLKKEMRRSGEPLKQTVNRCLRTALTAAAPVQPKPFKVRARAMGLPQGMSYENIGELLDQIEGPQHR